MAIATARRGAFCCPAQKEFIHQGLMALSSFGASGLAAGAHHLFIKAPPATLPVPNALNTRTRQLFAHVVPLRNIS
jgi:hypothetical protein